MWPWVQLWKSNTEGPLNEIYQCRLLVEGFHHLKNILLGHQIVNCTLPADNSQLEVRKSETQGSSYITILSPQFQIPFEENQIDNQRKFQLSDSFLAIKWKKKTVFLLNPSSIFCSSKHNDGAL